MHLTPMTWNLKWTTTASLHLVDPPLPIPLSIRLYPHTRKIRSIAHNLTRDPAVPRHTSAHPLCLPLTPLSCHPTRNTFVRSPIPAVEGLPWPTFLTFSMATRATPIIRRACPVPCHHHLLTTNCLQCRQTRLASLVALPDVSLRRSFTPAQITHQLALLVLLAFLPLCLARRISVPRRVALQIQPPL